MAHSRDAATLAVARSIPSFDTHVDYPVGREVAAGLPGLSGLAALVAVILAPAGVTVASLAVFAAPLLAALAVVLTHHITTELQVRPGREP